jgi:hypothetical protein
MRIDLQFNFVREVHASLRRWVSPQTGVVLHDKNRGSACGVIP